LLSKTELSNLARYALSALLALAFILGIYQHVTYRDFPYGPFRELDASLRARATPEDVIIHSNKLTLLPAIYHDLQLPQTFIGDPPGSKIDTLAPATQDILGIQAETDIRTATEEAQRVWYIIYQRALDEYGSGGHSIPPDLEYLDSEFILEARESWDGLRVYLYSRQP